MLCVSCVVSKAEGKGSSKRRRHGMARGAHGRDQAKSERDKSGIEWRRIRPAQEKGLHSTYRCSQKVTLYAHSEIASVTSIEVHLSGSSLLSIADFTLKLA